MNKAIPIVHCNPHDELLPDFGEVVLAIGIFDGVHLGHRALFAQARQNAQVLGVPLVAVTFDKDPDEIFRADDPSFGKLLPNEERLEMIATQVDGAVLSLPTVREVFGMQPDAFLDFLGSVCTPRAIFTGADFRFGTRASGTGADIARWAEPRGCTYIGCELVEEGGAVISATRIRRELSEGDVARAKYMRAGHAHAITGTVVHGRGAGEGFGFATANLDLAQNETMLPREGVYGAYAHVDGKRYATAVNVGTAKSFAEATAQIEAHLLDFEGDLYGSKVRIEFEQWLREPRVFETKEELIKTVMGNIDWVRENLGGK